jgi:F0F1-type ATP synthase membrane subunit a
VTTLGGLTMLLWSRPTGIRDAVSEKPELLALVLPVILFIATAGLDVPRMIPFLLPFWFFVLAAWARRETASLAVPLALATVLTIVTQHPWVRLNDTNYFVDWFPYSVHAARVNVSDAGFGAIWRLRVFIAAGGLAAFVAWTRLKRRSG